MSSRIVVTGGTGLLGRLVVDRLTTRGARVRVVSRRSQSAGEGREFAVADLRSGEGLKPAMANAEVIVHCATAFGRRAEARLASNVIDAARHAGRPHLVYISIVGVDRVPYPYYQGKLAAERLIARSGLPYTILRATQFHDLLRFFFARLAKAPVMPVPDAPCQPIDVSEVADRLAQLATARPAGRVADIAGPCVEPGRALARTFCEVTGRSRPVLPIRLPGKMFRAFHAGGHLAPEHAVGTVTFRDYLAAHQEPLTTAYRGQS